MILKETQENEIIISRCGGEPEQVQPLDEYFANYLTNE